MPKLDTSHMNHEGRELEKHIGIAAFIRNPAGELLVFEHQKWGFWTVPVGKNEAGETAEQAVRREMHEELKIVRFDLKKVYDIDVSYVRDGSSVENNLVGFELFDIKDEIVNVEPAVHKNFGYQSLDAIATLPALSDLLILYLNQQGVEHDHVIEGTLL